MPKWIYGTILIRQKPKQTLVLRMDGKRVVRFIFDRDHGSAIQVEGLIVVILKPATLKLAYRNIEEISGLRIDDQSILLHVKNSWEELPQSKTGPLWYGVCGYTGHGNTKSLAKRISDAQYLLRLEKTK